MYCQNKIPNILVGELDNYLSPRNDAEKRDKLKNGMLIHFDLPNVEPVTDEDKAADRERRLINADWLNELATKPERVVSIPIRINNAIIEGSLDLQYTTFEYELSITNSEFNGDVDLSFATFNRSATFNNSQFLELAKFRAAHAKGDFDIVAAQFADCDNFEELHEDYVFRADFQDLQVDYVFRADGACFGCVNFKRIKFAKSALFRPAIRHNKFETEGVRVPACFRGDANFSEAHIQGPAFFKGADFQKKATFDHVRIDSLADFSCFTDQDYVIRTRFRGETRFVGSQIAGNADFRGAWFDDQVLFDRSRITGNFYFQAFILNEEIKSKNKKIKSKVQKIKFERTRNTGENDFINKPLDFEFLPVHFSELASFIGAHINGSAGFLGAQFQGDAYFELIHIEGHALFRPASQNGVFLYVYFGGNVRFFHAHIEGNAEFDGAMFMGNAIFELIETSNIFFRPFEMKDEGEKNIGLIHVYFGKQVNFLSAVIKGEAHFSGAYFNDDASFQSMHVHGVAFFDSTINDKEIAPSQQKNSNPVHFRHKADFNNAHFKHDAIFKGGEFMGVADFTRVITEGAACFLEAKFMGKVSFSNASFSIASFREESPRRNGTYNQEQLQQFAEALKQQTQDARIRSRIGSKLWNAILRYLPDRTKDSLLTFLLRRAEGKKKTSQFGSCIDMRGFTYNRIEINLDELLNNKIQPYDRQPYAQLEKVYRAISDDDSMDKVYVKLRNRERENIRKRVADNIKVLSVLKAGRDVPYWILDYLHWRLNRYGTLPIMILIFSFMFIGAGTFMFTRQGAVKHKDKIDELISRAPDKLDPYGAFAVSLNQFIPIVEIPSGSQWKPSDKIIPIINPVPLVGSHITFATYGTIHRLIGAVLVPLGLATLTLLLYRRGKAG